MPGCGKRYTDPSSLRKHIKNHGHRVKVDCEAAPRKRKGKTKSVQNVGLGVLPTTPNSTPNVSGESLPTIVASSVATETPSQTDLPVMCTVRDTGASAIETVLSLVQSGLINQAADSPVIAINGNLFQVTNLGSSSIMPPPVTANKPTTQTVDKCRLVLPEGKLDKDTNTSSLQMELVIDDNDQICLKQGNGATTETGKSQDRPLDLSTCTGLVPVTVENSLQISFLPVPSSNTC